MQKKDLIALFTRKSVTWASGFVTGVWFVLQYPEYATTKNLLLLVGAVLLGGSIKLSFDNEKTKGKGRE